MSVKDISMIRAELFVGRGLAGQQLPARKAHGGAKASELSRHIRFIERCTIDLSRARMDAQDVADADAVRHAEAAPALLLLRTTRTLTHVSVSPKPQAISSHRARAASLSSVPSAAKSSSVRADR